MKKHVVILIFFMLKCPAGKTQSSNPVYQKAEKCVQDYMDFSRLGPGYSRDISGEIIDQFYSLFERDAFLYWDLYKSLNDNLPPPLPIREYVDLAVKMYAPKQPLLDYPRVKINILNGGKSAVAYLKKTHQILDGDDKPVVKNTIKLQLSINLDNENPLIQNIAEDKRKPFVRSISVGGNFIVWSNVFHLMTTYPVVGTGPHETFRKFNLSSGMHFQRGGMFEMRLNRRVGEGLLFATGIFYSETHLRAVMSEYTNSIPDKLEQHSDQAISLTTFERSPRVQEDIAITKIEIPLVFKSYLKDWVYLKCGTALGYVKGISGVNYAVSRTGGGLVTNLSSQNQVYLDIDHELDQVQFGYYRNKEYHFYKENFLNKMVLSIQIAAGFEKQFNYFCFGVEPNIAFGVNPVSTRSSPGSYQLTNVGDFHSVIELLKKPAYQFSFGFRLLISYVFKD